MTKLLIAIAIMFPCLIFGTEIANAAFPLGHRRARLLTRGYGDGQLRRVINLSEIQRAFLWLVVLAMLAISLYQNHIGNITQYFYLQFSESDLVKAELRREIGGTPYYLYNVALYSIAPYTVMVSYCHDAGNKRSHLPSALTIALFCVVLLGKFGTLSKAPPVIFILQLLLFRMLINSPNINFMKVVKLAFSAMLLFIAITLLSFSSLGFSELLPFLYYRIFDIPNEVLLEYFSAIPAYLPHGWGQSVLGSFSEEEPRLATYYAVAAVTRGSIDSTSNAMFIGDAWAQFAWFGVVFVSLLAGFFVRLVDLYSFRNGYTDQSACLIAGCSYAIITILTTSFTTGLVTGGLAIIPLLSIFFLRRSARTISVHVS